MNLKAAMPEKSVDSLASHLAGELISDRYACSLYATDASIYQIQPLAVVIPKTQADVETAVRWALDHRVPLIQRGGGTSLSGQSIGAGLIIDFSKYLHRILDVDPRAATARVEPGVVLDQLNAAVRKHGLQFGPDVATSSRANLGGMLGNNSAGSRSIKNGKLVDHVIETNCLLADGSRVTFGPLTAEQVERKAAEASLEGRLYQRIPQIVAGCRQEVIDRYPRILRRVSGYNLDEFVPECRAWYPPPEHVELVRRREAGMFPGAAWNLSKLLAGAEGTLACVTEMLLHLVPLPPHRGILVLHFESIAAAVSTVGPAVECGASAVELLDGEVIRLARQSLEYKRYLDFVVGDPQTLLIVELSGQAPREIESKVHEFKRRIAGQPGLQHVLEALDPRTCDHIWACRKASLPLLMGVPGARKPVAFVEDTAVSPERLPEFTARFRAIMQRHGTDGAMYGHASVGCLHIRPMLDTASQDDLVHLREISHEICELVMEFGGAMSGEHGDGLARSYLNERLFGPKLYQAFCDVKAAFDPQQLFNPGKVVHAPEPTENLRTRGDQQPLPLVPVFRYPREGGLAQAADLCNGSGVCRKTQTGTMCPSFMATHEEEHSTRGRANALRQVLSGSLPPEELTGKKLYDTFDLCLQCKGCKAECPSNVDVAKLKAEFLHHYWNTHGAPLGVRAMGRVARLNAWGSALAPLSNWLPRWPGAAWLQEKLLGVDRRRPLPRFERMHFERWFRRRGGSRAGSRGRVILLDDCLTSFCEPQVNRAAVEVLEAAGYEVQLARLHCCGRALISKGLLDEAQRLAAENVARLARAARAGVPIVGTEPSCILTLADDYRDLVPGEDTARVADQAMLIETLLVRDDVKLPLGRQLASALLHGHCHQKALVGTADTQWLLNQVPGLSAQLVDSGCCGMAGSFGYEHYEVSMAIGDRVLFPSVRAHRDGPVVAPGFSCRHQIAHGTGLAAVHPLEVVARRLEPAREGREE